MKIEVVEEVKEVRYFKVISSKSDSVSPRKLTK